MKVPTAREAGLQGFEASSWFALIAPAGTPREVIARLNAEATKILRDPKMVETFAGRGVRLVGNPVEDSPPSSRANGRAGTRS